MTTKITFFLHSGGRLVRDENEVLQYMNGKVENIAPMDVDLVNYFDLVTSFNKLGYNDLKTMFWMHPSFENLDIGLRALKGDKDINIMCEAAMSASPSNNCVMHLYFEHLVISPKDAELFDDYESSEDSLYQPSELIESDFSTDIDTLEEDEVHSKTALIVSANEDNDQASFENNGYDSYSEQMKTPESTDDEGISKPVFPVFNSASVFGEVTLELGMEFVTLDNFKNAVKDFNIALGRQFKWKKNEKLRARAVCSVDDCAWVAFCSWNSLSNTYQLKTYVSEHTCCRVFKNKAASREWVSKKLEKKLILQPGLKRSQAFDIMKEEFCVHINNKKLSRALKNAKKVIEGCEKEQYGRTWDYLSELLRSNPGSTTKMDVTPTLGFPSVFERLYICLDACKAGFKAGCRPLIGLDGCFLKGYYGGQLLSAVGQDANNQFYVIAYAVVDAETKENWKWFLTLLEGDIGDHVAYGWNFISDQQKGLLPALEEVMPCALHRNCVLHIWKNFKQWKDKELRGIVWECSKSTTEPEFKAHMERLKKKMKEHGVT